MGAPTQLLASNLPTHTTVDAIDRHRARKTDVAERVTDDICTQKNQKKLVFAVFGGMRAGKSSVMATIANNLIERGYSSSLVKIFRAMDNRGTIKPKDELQDGEVNDFYNRDGLNLPKGVDVEPFEFTHGVGYMIDLINKGEIVDNTVLILSEIQFCPDYRRLKELIKIAEEHNIVLIFDCLDRGFNAMPIPETAFLLAQIPEQEKHQLMPIDVIDGSSEAQVPARFLRWDVESHSIMPEDLSHSPKYLNLVDTDPERIQSMLTSIQQSKFAEALHKIDEDTGHEIWLLPAYPDDDRVVWGDKIYQPMSLSNLIEVWRILGEPDTALQFHKNYKRDPLEEL